MLSILLNRFSNDVALYVSGEYLLYGSDSKQHTDMPAYISLQTFTNRVLACGAEAKAMYGKEPDNIKTLRPFRMGAPWHTDEAEALVRYLMKKHSSSSLIPPRVVVTGSMASEAAKMAFKNLLTNAGARDVMLLETPMAAAIGLGLKVEEANLQTVLHIERDWMEISVISLAGNLAKQFEPIGFDNFLSDITIYSVESSNFRPDPESLSALLKSEGFDPSQTICGWEAWSASFETGRETTSHLNGKSFVKSCSPTFLRIREAYFKCIEQLPKEKRILLNAAPIHLTGEYANIAGLSDLLTKNLGRTVIAHQNSRNAAFEGTVQILSELKDLIPYVTHKKPK